MILARETLKAICAAWLDMLPFLIRFPENWPVVWIDAQGKRYCERAENDMRPFAAQNPRRHFRKKWELYLIFPEN